MTANPLFSATIPYPPTAKERARVTARGTFTPEKTRIATAAIKTFLAMRRPPELSEPVEVILRFLVARPKSAKRKHPTTRPDIDNYVKLVFDACNGVLWRDDSQVVKLTAEKCYTDLGGNPRIILIVNGVTDG